ncbi:MAG: glycosyltransferase family 39 protein [Candidatus Daviesbacteria bacterium]|nr:glycosyltransferase family 39 protein [Candidatus Daviesbacteria bacterium]
MKQIKSIVGNNLLLITILLALIIRLINIDFPKFSAEEAQVASRANFLISHGTDELGRKLPFIFNSSYDYQLPLTSYITAFGVLIFSNNDLGVRLPFILIGILIVILIYFISKILFKDKKLAYFSAIIAVASPGLVFFSKIPNEYIVLIVLMLILILLLLQEKINKFFIITAVILLLMTSKLAWFITVPIILLSFFLRNDLSRGEKINLIVLGSIPNILMVYIFLNIPQGGRSLIENNFSILNDLSIKNGIDRLRGQQIDGWPNLLDRILLNKSFLIIASFFHWLSYLQPSSLFGQIDASGKFGFLNQGGLSKIIIIPLLIGLVHLIKEKNKKVLTFFLFAILLSIPGALIYPKIEIGVLIIILPFLILISAFGMSKLKSAFVNIVIVFIVFEAILNSFFISSNVKISNTDRPFWIKQIVNEAYDYSKVAQVFFSDKIAPDPAPFIFWYTSAAPPISSKDNFPYKIIQRDIGAIKIINSDRISYQCKGDKINYFFLNEDESKTFEKNATTFQNFDTKFERIYADNFNQDRVYLYKSSICLKQ